MIIWGPCQSTFGNIFLNLKGMVNPFPKLKLETKLLCSRKILQKPLQSTFPTYLIYPLLLILRTILTSLVRFSEYSLYFWLTLSETLSRLRSTKCVGPDEIPNFKIKGCSEIFTPLLRHIFNLSLLTGKFTSLWKQSAVISIFKTRNRALAVNYRPISILKSFSGIFVSITHDHLSFNFKSKLHPNQHDFVK
jgi:hypothetical protein